MKIITEEQLVKLLETDEYSIALGSHDKNPVASNLYDNTLDFEFNIKTLQSLVSKEIIKSTRYDNIIYFYLASII